MTPWPHQILLSQLALGILKVNGLVYLACEERTGKTIAAILTAEACDINNVLVITKKNAKPDWKDTLAKLSHTKNYEVTNYHQAHKSNKPDLIILDESHNYISAFPKPGTIWKELKKLCKGLPLIYISATPHAQGRQMLYHQFALSSWSPWASYSNFYNWFRTFGKLYQIEINSIKINQYDRCDQEFIKQCTDHLFITKTRAELDFKYEPEDHLCYIELGPATKWAYNELVKHGIVELFAGTLVCDTASKLRYALHMLEGGTAKLGESRIELANTEKIDYVKSNFGDNPGLVIMYNYIMEGIKLRKYFKQATILQATSNAEGIDLHKFDNLVIYSQDYSTSRHTQRRARQANKNRDKPIIVYYLLVKKGISEQVYKTVSVNKKNFVDSVFERLVI